MNKGLAEMFRYNTWANRALFELQSKARYFVVWPQVWLPLYCWAFRVNAAEARKGTTVIGMPGTVYPLSSRNDDRLCPCQKVNRR